MFLLIRYLLVCLALVFAGSALQAREVHVVAVGNGHRTSDFYALPEARILVDRPGREVSLVLLGGADLRWQVEATKGTLITGILRGGPGGRYNEVSLFGIPVDGAQVAGLPLVFQPLGRDFRGLLDVLAGQLGTQRIHSFQGLHKATANPIRVDHVDTGTPELARDYLSRQVQPADDLPQRIRDWLNQARDADQTVLDFDEAGIRLSGPGGIRYFPVPPDIPTVVLPVMAVHDPLSRMIYALTYGGEGYIYAVDVQSGTWRIITSLNGYDAAGLLFDPQTRQLITTGAFSRPGDIRLFGMDGVRVENFIHMRDFPGLTDLFDYGNEHGPALMPRVYSGGWLLVEARGAPDGSSRLYAVHIETGRVRLLRFEGG